MRQQLPNAVSSDSSGQRAKFRLGDQVSAGIGLINSDVKTTDRSHKSTRGGRNYIDFIQISSVSASLKHGKITTWQIAIRNRVFERIHSSQSCWLVQLYELIEWVMGLENQKISSHDPNEAIEQ